MIHHSNPHLAVAIRQCRRERGAALVIGLVLLLVLTVLAVATMNMSTSDLRMVANRQFQENAFQAAERGVELAMLRQNLPTTGEVITQEETEVPDSPADTYEYEISFDPESGVTNVPSGGYSLGTGSGFSAYHFDVESTGTSARGAEVVHEQSFYIIGPSSR
jgi:type IV pilus assembly protein PilX